MAVHITSFRDGFTNRFTEITSVGEVDDAQINFGILKLQSEERWSQTVDKETAYLLLNGHIEVRFAKEVHQYQRDSVFDSGPFCAHISAYNRVEIRAHSNAEVAVISVPNNKAFSNTVYLPKNVATEHRGQDLLNNTCYRHVRTIFDGNNTPLNCELVLGEVVNFPGTWSSYPPHHHPQPEVYHYRFTDPRGYGHCELGEEVIKVRHYDTVKILDSVDHPQCAAPGYGMYYIWMIRHLPANRYSIPIFTDEHKWTLDPEAPVWKPNTGALN
ncbi:MAG: 5-deoxyglucuronate isomerase [Waddliaceae bacterium]|nr:5-deoxyglucuronate isomerase [Waddliaceae bacterium]